MSLLQRIPYLTESEFLHELDELDEIAIDQLNDLCQSVCGHPLLFFATSVDTLTRMLRFHNLDVFETTTRRPLNRTFQNCTFLGLCVRRAQHEMIDYLFHHFDRYRLILDTNEWGRPPFAESQDVATLRRVLSHLPEHERVMYLDLQDHHGLSYIQYASDEGILKYLIQIGVEDTRVI